MFDLTDNNRPYRGRRLTWLEFEKLTGRPRPVYVAANDNGVELGHPVIENAARVDQAILSA